MRGRIVFCVVVVQTQAAADLLAMPYNYLVDPAVRATLHVQWDNVAAVIFDEVCVCVLVVTIGKNNNNHNNNNNNSAHTTGRTRLDSVCICSSAFCTTSS